MLSQTDFLIFALGIFGIICVICEFYSHKDIKIESEDPDGWPRYITYEGRIYCKFEEMAVAPKFKRACAQAHELFEKYSSHR